MQPQRRIWIIPIILLAFIIVPFLLWGETFEALLSPAAMRALLERHRGIAWLIGITLLVADLFLPIPSTIVMSALGWLYGPLIGGIVASCGLFLSAQLAYQLSLRFGRPIALRLADEASLRTAAEWFSRTGGACVAVSRCLPVLSEAIACLAGLSRFPQRDFLAATLLGTLPAGFAFAFIGQLGHEDSATATALSAIVPILLWLAYRRISRVPASKPTEIPQKVSDLEASEAIER
jgi:uncharacterized membrane protein YdjX (TVP38/TMEM64 family)